MLACPNCKTNITTSKALAELPPKIKCPGCGHIDAKESFCPVNTAYRQDELDALTKIAAPPRDPTHQTYANQFAAEVPVRQPVKLSAIDKLMNIEYQSTQSYAGYLWIMAILAGFGVDALAGIFILITSGKSIIASGGTVLAVHLIALPVIRIVLEAFVNLERIAKR